MNGLKPEWTNSTFGWYSSLGVFWFLPWYTDMLWEWKWFNTNKLFCSDPSGILQPYRPFLHHLVHSGFRASNYSSILADAKWSCSAKLALFRNSSYYLKYNSDLRFAKFSRRENQPWVTHSYAINMERLHRHTVYCSI